MSGRRRLDRAEVPFDALERQQLCDLLVELGPDARQRQRAIANDSPRFAPTVAQPPDQAR